MPANSYLSDLIRVGCLRHPEPATESFFRPGDPMPASVIGAAHAGWAARAGSRLSPSFFETENGYLYDGDLVHRSDHPLNKALKRTEVPGTAIPVTPDSDTSAPLYRVMRVLNDTHRWDRERIADWLEASGLDPAISVSTGWM